MTPWILNQVASVADAVEDIALGTANGPMRFGLPFLRVMSAASISVRVDGPPEPMTMPVRSWLMSASSSPASSIACFMATWFQAPPRDRKRMARRSTMSVGSSVGAPQTWLLKPCSAKSSLKLMPDLAVRSESVTSLAVLPMEDTIPMPVTTTRLMSCPFMVRVLKNPGASFARLQRECQVVLSLARPTFRSVAL